MDLDIQLYYQVITHLEILFNFFFQFYIDGYVYSFGGNNNGQLGIGSFENQSKPQKLPFSNVISIASLGIGNKINQSEPQKLPLSNVKSISCGFNFTFAILSISYTSFFFLINQLIR